MQSLTRSHFAACCTASGGVGMKESPQNDATACGPLSGYRVVDISHHMAGPAATQKLGDFGADVVKVEPPGAGEWTRTRPIGDSWVGDVNTSFLSLNRNKRSIGINLKDAEGYDLFCELVRAADVIVVNFRPEVCRRLRVDYETLQHVNPRLIYCSITGFGGTGPHSGRPGQDLLIQAFSGLTWNGGVEGGPPVPAPTFIADSTTGNQAVIGILAALLARQKTGMGQQVEVNLLSSMMDVQIQELTTYLNTGNLPHRSSERLAHPLINAPYGIHRTADGWIAVAMAEPATLAEALGLPKLAQFIEWTEGFAHRDEIFRAVAEVLATLTTEEAITELDRHAVWCGRVNTYADLAHDPQVLHNGMIQSVPGRNGTDLQLIGSPIQFSSTPSSIRTCPPELGEHTDEILAEFGISAAKATTLRAAGAIQ
jgi:crotonobetainyl-CoA:carnitine CoA-transferase CaiB-like acyl-CoA transferase